VKAGPVFPLLGSVWSPAERSEAWRGFWRLLAAEALAEVAWYRFFGVYEHRGTALIESRLVVTLLLFY